MALSEWISVETPKAVYGQGGISDERKSIFSIIPAILFAISSFPALADDASEIKGPEQSGAIDCATARDDVATLKAEKKATSDRAMDGILAVKPIGLVTNFVTGGDQRSEDQKMDAEQYNKLINQRIEEIQATCGEYFSDDNIAE